MNRFKERFAEGKKLWDLQSWAGRKGLAPDMVPGDSYDVLRRDLIELLMDRVVTVPQLAREIGEAPKDVASDFKHLIRSLKHTDYEPVIVPAECRKCGFEFSEEKLLKPSKCPKCDGTWIYPPQIGVKRTVPRGRAELEG